MTRARLLPHPWLSLILLLVWLLLVNSVALGHVLLAALLAWALPLLLRDFLFEVPRLRQPLRLVLFGLRILGDIVTANLHVARLVLGPREQLQPAFIEVPMALRNEFLLTVLTSIVSLTPGTVSASLSADRRTLLLHALDAAEPEQVVAQVKQRYEAPLLEMFECSPT
jgi:multicomponent K+:H+ antiporter subunit E